MNIVVKLGRVMSEEEAINCRCPVSMGSYAINCKGKKCPKWINISDLVESDIWEQLIDTVPEEVKFTEKRKYGFCTI